MRILLLGFLQGFIFCLIFFSASPVERRKTINGNNIPSIKQYVQHINEGGCGYFAMKLYERLEPSQYKIVLINNGNHIAILEKATGYFIDANGYRDSLSFQLAYPNNYKVISYKKLKKMVDNIPEWNPAFDRKDTAIINRYIDQL